ncbi:MAG: 1-acyl-sn-glycerol-3-phosphate acyltransferase [Candidatus Phytoplasma sp.]|nr:1-acyl-sn-glycerol-3-phosphate acyltransferase [Phytoplasma sp.]
MNDNNEKVPYDPNEGTLETIKARPVTIKKDYPFFNRNIFFRITSFVIIWFFKIFVEILYARIFMGFRVKNKKYYKSVKKESFMAISNHIHPLDTFLIGTTFLPKKLYVLMRESNLGVPFFGRIMRLAGGVPIPTKKDAFVQLLRQIPETAKRKEAILMMPETALRMYYVGIRPFSNGAFKIALSNTNLILPSVYIYKKPKGLMKYLKKKPYIHLHFLEPIKIVSQGKNHETISYYNEYTNQLMTDYFNKHSDLQPEEKK